MADLDTIRDAIKAQLIAQMTGEPTIYARLSSSMNPPALLIFPRQMGQYAMGRAKRMEYDLWIFALLGKGMDDANWDSKLSDFLAPTGNLSVIEALRADRTLSGAVATLTAQEGWVQYGAVESFNGIEYMTARLGIHILGKEPA